MDAKAVIALPSWLVYKTITKEVKLLRQIPIGEDILMRPMITGSYDPPNLIKSIWIINYWAIDVDTPILTPTPTIVKDTTTPSAPIINDIPIGNFANEMESEAVIEANDNYLSAISPLVVINPSEKHSLMRFTAVVSQENLTSKADS